jgi:hypothetical protein
MTESPLYSYVPITRPNPNRWPGGRGLAVYVALGVEDYRFGEGLTENILPGMPAPDFANASWRDYGNRVGGFRLANRLNDMGFPLSVLLNTMVYDTAPELVATLRGLGAEMIGHGVSNSDTLAGMTPAEERSYLSGVLEKIAAEEGSREAIGWSSPWLTQTPQTLSLLAELGYGYVLDLNMDDRCVWLDNSGKRLLCVPYGLEINDSSTTVGRQADADDFARMIIDQFDELLLASTDQPLVMSIVLHSFISGQPFRLAAVTRALRHIAAHADRVWLTTPGAIQRCVRDTPGLAV